MSPSAEPDLTGQTLAHYKTVERIGIGGMGIVYRAVDTLLDRNVAIKVLPQDKMSDPERKRRFIQEAKTASALNHPNIVTIYEIGTAGAVSFIAMEYVAGATLAQLIGSKGLPIPQVLDYGVQIADALASAHAAGIVHRDLKPLNVIVTAKGHVKVLDFGLAKLAEVAKVGDETVTMDYPPLTVEGALVGTVTYMSPEQAEGKKVDTRSDIFAFGAVLYEMVTGRPAFAGEGVLATVVAICSKEPKPIGEISGEGAAELEQIIVHCLRKEPDRRFQRVEDVKIALEELRREFVIQSLSGVKSRIPSSLTVLPRRRSRTPWMAGIGAALILLLAGTLWMRTKTAPEKPWIPLLTRLTADRGMSAYPALSPDGKLVAYASDRNGDGNLDIWVQQIGGGDPIRITNDPADEYEPAFSADGTQLAFRSDRGAGGVYLAPALGGPSRLIAEHGRRPRFSPDGKQILYWVGSGMGKLYLADLEGGKPHEFQPGFPSARFPVWSPDGYYILFQGFRDSKGLDPTGQTGESLDWWIAPTKGGPAVKTGALKVFQRAGMSAPVGERIIAPEVWTAAGQVIFSARLGGTTNVWEIAIPPQSRQVAGAPQRLTLGTNLELHGQLITMPDGQYRMAFASLTRSVDLWGLSVNANQATVTGKLERLTQDVGIPKEPAVSLDGKRIVFISTRSGNDEIWLKDIGTGKETPINRTPGLRSEPAINADGTMVAYEVVLSPKVTSVFTAAIGPDGLPLPATKLCELCGGALSWSPDGRKLMFGLFPPAHVLILDIASGKRLELLRQPLNNIWQSAFSPDGRWVSFNMTTSPIHSRVYVARVPEEPALIPMSQWIPITGGEGWDDKPRWSPDGKILYFISQRDGFRCIWRQRLNPASKLPVGSPSALYHLHSNRRSMANVDWGALGLGVARDKLIFNLGELTGNIWIAQAQSQP